MTDLSPVAQAVLDAYGSSPLLNDHVLDHRRCLAASLRAVVEQLGYSNVPEEFAHLMPLVIDSDDLLEVVAELEK